MTYLLIVLATALLATDVELVTARAVNISNVWLLPEEGFPVFYRYFRDRITWFEADAVCQFHHAQLVTEIGDVQRAEAFSNNGTVDSSDQFDATRAYLKELDVVNHVWVGLKRSGTEGEFTWTDYKPLENGGYWQEQIPMTDNSVCAALDPAADFRWHPLKCGGPEVASFICQLEVPAWARKEDGCMLTSLPSLTVTYLPEQGAVELISDCGLEGTRRIACKGQANREEMMKQLSCETSTESQTEATSSWDNELPTRHRRDTDVTVDMASVQHILHTTEGLTEVNIVEITDQPPSAELKENLPSTTGDPETSSMQVLPQEMSVAEEPIKTSPGVLSDDLPFQHSLKVVATETVKTKNPERPSPVMFPISGGFAGFAADDSLEKTSNRRVVPVASKPIPPSLKGNSPFIEPVITLNKTDNSEENGDNTTPKPVEDESHELFTGSKGSSDNIPQQEKHDSKTVNFPPLSVYTINKDHDIDESSVRGSSSSPVQRDIEISTTAFPPATIKKSEEVNNSKDDLKFFTRVIAYDNTKGFSTPSSLVSETKTTNKNDDFLFVVTESPDKSSSKLSSILRTTIHSRDFSTTKPETTDTLKTEIRAEETLTDKEMGDEAEPEIPERPNRGRLLIRPQHHSFYPYFLNRVLG